uniref:Autophagy-related protein 18h n=1 Tax=Kalanchoe fedtschenkoi TaxID=63787 RepID=A0A7N0UT80_KALFE
MNNHTNKPKNSTTTLNNNIKDNNSSISSTHHHRVIPKSWKYISSCLKTASANVRSAGASVAASLSTDSDALRDQVLWASFDKLELGSSSFRHLLLLGYTNGFQVIDVQDASSISELVSKRDNPVTFLQMQPTPLKSNDEEGFGSAHPLLLVVASDESKAAGSLQNVGDGHLRDGYSQPQVASSIHSPTAVRFYSLRSHNYVHVLRFRSAVYMVRCSPQVVAVGLASQIYCFDALTYENKFSVLTYPVPQIGGQTMNGTNIGYGPMAVGQRWLAYASNNPLLPSTSRLSPQSLTPSPGVSPSTSPGNGNLVARYAMESSKQLAAGLMNLGDMGYKTLSKYCQELLPDGSSSPVQSNTGWKATKVGSHSTESDSAGTVVIKDLVSKAVVSQFKAHSSPISALCFDPSGTLLVTASIHGNNINIFRILPSCAQNGSGNRRYDWSSSHTHLYKLHRGITSAVIQDICFSHFSQWIAIITSKGTCHIYVLSPFGGDSGLQKLYSPFHQPSLLPILSHPWWSTPSFRTKQQSFPRAPPSPVTLSVVSRIKCGNYGWLNSVSNAASTASGKVSIPSGALAAVFHCCLSQNSPPSQVRTNSLEYILAYTPSGLVTQYKLVPSMNGEQSETSSRPGSGSVMQLQEEDLKVKVEPVQWWDVCRRIDWPDIEEPISEISSQLGGTSGAASFTLGYEDNGTLEEDYVKPQNSHFYLSNAEVHINSARVPIWQNSKISFCMMDLTEVEEQYSILVDTGGEVEIEKIHTYEIEIRRKELRPLFDQSQNARSGLAEREKYSTSPHRNKDSLVGASPLHYVQAENSEVSSRRYDPVMAQKQGAIPHHYVVQPKNRNAKAQVASGIASSVPYGSSMSPDNVVSPKVNLVDSSHLKSRSPSSNNSLPCGGISVYKEVDSTNNRMIGGGTLYADSNCSKSTNKLNEGAIQEPLDFGQYFHEEYCTASTLDGSHQSADIIANVENPGNVEKSEEDEDGNNDDMLGAVFAFSEEG